MPENGGHPVDLVRSEYEVDMKRPGCFLIKNGDGLSMSLFADLKYRRMESTNVVRSYGTIDTLAYAPYSRL